MSLDKILAELGIDQEKTASAELGAPESNTGESHMKLAEDIEAAGVLMAESFFSKIAELSKEAADRASSSHPSSGGHKEPSNWSGTAERLGRLRSMGMPGSEGHTRAEEAYKRTMAKSPVKGGEAY